MSLLSPSFMTTNMTTKTMTPKSSSILAEAMDVLLEHLGPQKTAELWHVIAPPGGDYLTIRPTLFAGMDATAMDREIRKFNHE